MSTKLAPIDLSAAVAGNVFTVDWSTIQQNAGIAQYAQGVSDHLTVYNESGCGLAVALNNTGRTFTLPAGAWIPGGIPLSIRGTADTKMTVVVIYVLSGAGVSQLLTDYFNLGEPVVSVSQVLGNSPVNVGSTALPTNIFTVYNQAITGLGTTTLFVNNVTQGVYRLGGSLYFNSSGVSNTHPTFNVAWTDPNAGSTSLAFRSYTGAVVLDGSETLAAPTNLPLEIMEVPISSGLANLQVSYTQGLSAGVNDHISLTIEKVG